MSIQDPLGLPHEIHLDIEYYVSTYFGPSMWCFLAFIQDLECHANIHHLLVNCLSLEIIFVLCVNLVGIFNTRWNLNSIFLCHFADPGFHVGEDHIPFPQCVWDPPCQCGFIGNSSCLGELCHFYRV